MNGFEAIEARKNSGLAKKVIYQIFLRAFTPEGTIKAATEKLEHVASLGVDIVYIVSFCEADDDRRVEYWSPRQRDSKIDNSKNPYRISNYEKIDEEYGTAEDFREFVRRAHELGMLVMNDLVYMHCGPSVFPYEHPDFIKRDDAGEIIYNSYHFPDLDYGNPELREYLWNNMLYWIREFDIDGYRCDVGDHVPLDFWREGRRRIDAVKPDFLMINEGVNADFLVDTFDANYDTLWSGTIGRVIKGERTHHDLRCVSVGVMAKNPDGALTLRGYENHDIANDAYDKRLDRISYENTEAAIVISFLLEGVPFLYNGNEFADSVRHSLWSLKGDEFRIDWSALESDKGKRRMDIVKKLCAIRHSEPALCFGTTNWEKHPSLAVFEREYQNDVIRVFVNFSKQDVTVPLPEGDILLSGRVNIKNKDIALLGGGYVAVKFKKDGV